MTGFVGTWKAKCPIFKAIVAGFRGKVALKDWTLGVPGSCFSSWKVGVQWSSFFRPSPGIT